VLQAMVADEIGDQGEVTNIVSTGGAIVSDAAVTSEAYTSGAGVEFEQMTGLKYGSVKEITLNSKDKLTKFTYNGKLFKWTFDDARDKKVTSGALIS
jgi:hypothetical protein